MAIYGDAFYNAARLDAAAAELGRVSLRRGRYAPAQLWKLTSISGRYIELGQMLAPLLGDVEAVVPYELIQVFRHLEAFRMPTRQQQPNVIHVVAWAEEVRGMPARYFQVGDLRERAAVMPRNATRNGYADVRVPVTVNHLFNAAWMRRFHAEWPMVLAHGVVEAHPALERLIATTAATNFAIMNHMTDRRTREINRRRRQAAQYGLQVDDNGRLIPNVVINANDADSDSDV